MALEKGDNGGGETSIRGLEDLGALKEQLEQEESREELHRQRQAKIRPLTTPEEYLAEEKRKNRKAEMLVEYVLDKTDFSDERFRHLEDKTPAEVLDLVWKRESSSPGEVIEDGGNEVFELAAHTAITELITHGILKKEANGEYVLQPFSDLDGKTCIGLFRAAGFSRKVTKVGYVPPGEAVEGAVDVDTGGSNVNYKKETRTMYVDHHALESTSDTSAAGEVYDILTRCGLLEPSMTLEGLVSFVTYADNGNYPESHTKANFLNSWKTLIGLSRFLGFDEMKEFFSDLHNDPLRPLTPEQMEKWPYGASEKLEQRAERLRIDIRRSESAVENLTEKGMFIEIERNGEKQKVLIDIGDTVPLGRDAAFAFGYDIYVRWNPDENGFVVFTQSKIEDDFEQGLPVRNMWIKPKNEEPLKFGLGHLLGTLARGDYEAHGDLKEYLDKEKEETSEPVGDVFADLEEEDFGDLFSDLEEEGAPAGQDKPKETGDLFSNLEEEPAEVEPEIKDDFEIEEPSDQVEQTAEMKPAEVFEEEAEALTPGAAREETIESASSTTNLVSEFEKNERLATREEKESLQRMEERQRQFQVVQQLRSDIVRNQEEEERRPTVANIFSGVFFRRAFSDARNWWRRTFR